MTTEKRYICSNIGSTPDGHLTFAGQDTLALAAAYGTPLYLFDEERIRYNCRVYTEAFKRNFRPGSRPLYASKAASFKQIYRIAAEEDMGIDVVSCGEIYTAYVAGYDLTKACFHSNNKTDEDVAFAMEHNVGCFIVDNVEEIYVIEREAAQRNRIQKIMLRITPGIDPHTYKAINTGEVDSKFGSALETGQAKAITVETLKMPHIELIGFHCHVGSQVFAEDVFERTARVMLGFIADMKKELGYETRFLNLGGGYGVPYVASDGTLNIGAKLDEVASVIHETCAQLAIEEPAIMMEPGRSIVADAGMTLYTVGTLKTIPGYKRYVSIDGGMTDNPRFALYGARYTCLNAGKQNEASEMECSVVGRCCESGDIIQENVKLPASTARGDIVAVCTTGAYNYSMASNYNRLPRPPIVMLKDGKSSIAVRRETLEDLIALDN